MMKHCLHDPEQEKEFGNFFTVYSCEFDNGERANGNNEIIRIGENGKIMLFLCVSCLEQLRGQILGSLVFAALRDGRRIPEIILETIKNKRLNDE